MHRNCMLLLIVVVPLVKLAVSSTLDGISKNYEVFSTVEKSKWIQVYQLEQILVSIEETYKAMNEKQKQDALSITQMSTELQLINQRLQNIENVMAIAEQSESFNKIRFQQLADNAMKGEIQFDDLKRKVDKNQQQTINRLTEMDLSLEKMHIAHDSLHRELRKTNLVQEKIVSGIEEIIEFSKSKSDKLIQNLTTSQQHFHSKILDIINNTETRNDWILPLVAPSNKIVNTLNANSCISSNFHDILSRISDNHNSVRDQEKLLITAVDKCVSLTEKVHHNLDQYKESWDGKLNELEQNIIHEIDQLEIVMKNSFSNILEEQDTFSKNCRRLNIHEEDIETKTVDILEKLFKYINNKTEGIHTELRHFTFDQEKRNELETNEIRKLKELLNTRNDLGIEDSKKENTKTLFNTPATNYTYLNLNNSFPFSNFSSTEKTTSEPKKTTTDSGPISDSSSPPTRAMQNRKQSKKKQKRNEPLAPPSTQNSFNSGQLYEDRLNEFYR